MSKTPDIVFLFDVDNTLIDNDRVQAHLSEHLERTYGVATRDRYWQIFEQLRSELGYADYLGALERYRMEDLHRPEVLRMSSWRRHTHSRPTRRIRIAPMLRAARAVLSRCARVIGCRSSHSRRAQHHSPS
jgi:beta-phosphoglucomutase-like phosphatase (HAD superfamily)